MIGTYVIGKKPIIQIRVPFKGKIFIFVKILKTSTYLHNECHQISVQGRRKD